MCPCRLERVSWPFDASVSAMIAYDLIFGAAAFAGLCAGVSDLFFHIEQIDSGLPANRGRILKDLVMILVPAFFVALPLMLLHISRFDLAAPAVQPLRFQGGRMRKREMELGVSYGQHNKGGWLLSMDRGSRNL